MGMDEQQPQFNTNPSSLWIPITKLVGQVDRMEQDVQSIRRSLEEKYVTMDQFQPVKQVVYGLVSIILVLVMGGIVSLVISRR